MPIRYNDKHYDFDGDVYTGDKLVFQRQRRGIPITYWRHWYRSAIQNTDALDVSIAVRHNLVDPDKVYVAYVSAANVLTVKSAVITARAEGMTWTTELTQANCAFCSLAFDGDFMRDPDNPQDRVIFRTDNLPWLFYSTVTGQLMGGIIGTTYETVVGANVTSFDAIRGVRGLMGTNHGIDEGLLVFYVLDGVVFYRPYKYGEWGDQEIVSIAPENIVNIKAERTFDWRIVLQVEDTLGKLYEVFTESYVSGNTNVEFLQILPAKIDFTVTDIRYHNAQAPVEYLTILPPALTVMPRWAVATLMADADNIAYTDLEIDVENDYGYKVRIVWEHPVSGETSAYSSFLLVDSEETEFAPVSMEYIDNYTIDVLFQNFNNAVGKVTVQYSGVGILGEIGQSTPATSISFTPTGLVPYVPEPPVVVSIINIQDWEGSL